MSCCGPRRAASTAAVSVLRSSRMRWKAASLKTAGSRPSAIWPGADRTRPAQLGRDARSARCTAASANPEPKAAVHKHGSSDGVPHAPETPAAASAAALVDAAQERAQVLQKWQSGDRSAPARRSRARWAHRTLCCAPSLLVLAHRGAHPALRRHWRCATMIRLLLTGALRVRARCRAVFTLERQTLPRRSACLTPSRSTWSTAWRAALRSTGAARSSQVR